MMYAASYLPQEANVCDINGTLLYVECCTGLTVLQCLRTLCILSWLPEVRTELVAQEGK